MLYLLEISYKYNKNRVNNAEQPDIFSIFVPMKKIAAIIAAAFVGIFAAHAQMEVCGGYAGSMLVDTFTADDGYKTSVRAVSHGFYAGFTSLYVLPANLTFRYSILYSRVSSPETDFLYIMGDMRYRIIAETGTATTIEHYITVPAVAEYTFSPLKGFGIFANAGLGVSYCLSSRSWTSWPGLDGTNYWNVDHLAGDTNYNGYSRFDILVTGGIGCVLAGCVRIEGGVDYGLADRSSSGDSLHRFGWHGGIAYLF